ncbi:hypothetical protein [Sandaracinus amylolyticus]|uniref:hypothetical protein n=1 Tax=Sandaracinus amylolyticus TaxID=927083 RepID=UPI001F3138F5|nr:hypothetical protein [Sandaracinus amylolyticus]
MIEREVLYREVWAEPMTKVGARYGTTATKLAKVCDQLDVPCPSSGYWVQLAHGTAPERPPLPALRPGAPAGCELVPTPPKPRSVAAEAERGASRIVVPEVIKALHPLLRDADARKRGRRDEDAGAHAAIHVSDALRDRGVRVMHVILTELDRRALHYAPLGSRERYGRRERESIAVEIEGESVRFYLFEWTRSAPLDPEAAKRAGDDRWKVPHAYLGDGRLRIRIEDGYSPPTWRDEEGRPVEQRLNAFIRGLYVAAESQRARRLAAEKRERAEREAQARREREAALQRHHEALVADAEQRVRALDFAVALRALAGRIEARGVGGERESAWSGWARRLAAQLDDQALSDLPDVVPNAASDADCRSRDS